MANGQCMAIVGEPFLDRGGMAAVAGAVVEDVALARAMAADGARVGFLDASDLLTVRMFESFGDTWRGWGRSLALPGVEPPRRQVVDLAVIVLAQVLPLPRLLSAARRRARRRARLRPDRHAGRHPPGVRPHRRRLLAQPAGRSAGRGDRPRNHPAAAGVARPALR